MDRKIHWEPIYTTKPPGAVSWFRAEPRLSLRLLDAAGLRPASRVIDIGGGDSRVVDRLVERGLVASFPFPVTHNACVEGRANHAVRAAHDEQADLPPDRGRLGIEVRASIAKQGRRRSHVLADREDYGRRARCRFSDWRRRDRS